ncbi:MAG: CpsD/CapB family tyrosine-protein kinase [Clostridium sp.]|jgi:capsular exopolysaccharide synthesis family protein|uniref:CpsD/CapB family tyrosine-protein kinase n=1 Tax=Clostridium sp. TaxID=1506 RepID=UPI0025B86FC4|nr:CpsD/CapB family tyrosine-protein kinase [Clostridium sp.]MCH3965049.1 CpsD/CapB family tyrosine-protein kinase [Clostridium sp.]MCI1714270.1 CpsD/CapB family tyrosine-protein kinase [Clostridium sp.]MCI1798532.1 CpsD/CapB family tyrosine-protein kinase [Clostridium sp.]MCI1812737.1 CpsD/CapB family tyrosine-protein kinase [Clostridium sp.]MCI1869341.1 CpsD/CapB family tyrosine-protein kinase [Clostridium sp.]
MQKPDLVTIKNPRAPISEAYRTLRTNIQFSSFDKKIQTIMLTSSGPGEGKSTTASNLAVVMAESGSSTILIDCDQRKPKLHKIFFTSNQAGLSDVLADKIGFEDVVKDVGIENLSLLTSGTKPPNPAELLGSKKMGKFIEDLKNRYEYIIIDTPPIIAVTDAQLLSRYADGCLLVVASSQAERDAAVKAKQLLEKVNANILGTVLNKLEVREKGYYGYYYSYYDEDGNKHKKRKKRK